DRIGAFGSITTSRTAARRIPLGHRVSPTARRVRLHHHLSTGSATRWLCRHVDAQHSAHSAASPSRPDRDPLAAVLKRLRHRALEWTASARSGPPPWSPAGWHRASIATSVGAGRVAIGGVGGGWAPGGSSGARTGLSPPRPGTGGRARRVRIPVATTASGHGGAVEVDQAGDAALRRIVHPLVVHENVHLVEQERARDLVRGDPVRLLDQGLALV